jgi:thiol-disulfide isomerase/thioredoxin
LNIPDNSIVKVPRLIGWIAATVAASGAALQMRDVDGQLLSFFQPSGKISLLFFISSDCPISNSYAPEIQRICQGYGPKGVACSLLYEDLAADSTAVRKHLEDYRFRGIPAVIDARRAAAKQAKATVTPEAVLVDHKGEIRYRGRIDNFYAALGKPRRQVTVHDLTDALDAVLAGKMVANPQTQALGCYIVDPEILKR